MMIGFVIAGFVCAVAALCYSELASMVPVAGLRLHLYLCRDGRAARLDGRLGADPRICGRRQRGRGRLVGLCRSACSTNACGGSLAAWLMRSAPLGRSATARGRHHQPARLRHLAARHLRCWSSAPSESARVNAVLVLIKIIALTVFIVLTLPGAQRRPISSPSCRTAAALDRACVGAAASIFFAYVGFDAVSTAAEETKNPQRNVPIGLIGSLLICTIFYLLVAAGAIGAIGAQPVSGAARRSPRAGLGRTGRASARRSSPAASTSRWSAPRKRWPTCCARSAGSGSATWSASPPSSRCRRSC